MAFPKCLQDARFLALPPKIVQRWLMGIEIIFALIVLGTSAAVISDFSTWSSCTSSTTSTAQYCTIISTSPQGYINIALFTSIIGFLFIGTLAVGEHVVHGETPISLPVTASRSGHSSIRHARSNSGLDSMAATGSTTSHMDHKVLFVASLVFHPLLWVFWFTSVITTTMLCDDAKSKWGTLNAACAFTWFSWFATSGSCYFVGREVWQAKSGKDAGDTKAGGGQRAHSKSKSKSKSKSSSKVTVDVTTSGSGLRSSDESELSRGSSKGGVRRDRTKSKSKSQGSRRAESREQGDDGLEEGDGEREVTSQHVGDPIQQTRREEQKR